MGIRMKHTDMAVIGGGLAGLTAGYCIAKAGKTVTVFEASDRVGGRIDSILDAAGVPIADLGPTWVWPSFQPVVSRWLEQMHVPTFKQFDDGDAVLEDLGGRQRRMPLPGQVGIARIESGPSALVDALAKGIPPGSIRMGMKAVRIEEVAGDRLELTFESGERISALAVVLAVPLRVAAQNIGLAEAPASLLKLMRDTPTWMATQAKAVAIYETPFWRDEGLSGRVASREGPLVEIHDHSPARGGGALFGFVGWPPDRRDPSMLKSGILNQLERCFGPRAARPNVLSVRDWALDPLICSDLDMAMPVEHPDVRPDSLRHPTLGSKLFLAVSETSDISPGLIEGALAAGERGARLALATVDQTTQP
jgi:monoamine oxidase